MKETIYYPSTAKLTALALISLVFALIGVWAALTPPGREFPQWMQWTAAWIGTPFFGLAGLYALIRLIFKSPLVIINQEGVTDHASALGVGLIPWQEVRGAEIYMISKQRFLSVQVHDPEALICRQPLIKRIFLRMNKGIWDAPVSIPQSALAVPLEDVAAAVTQGLAAFQTTRKKR